MFDVKVGDVVLEGLDLQQVSTLQTILIQSDIKHFVYPALKADEQGALVKEPDDTEPDYYTLREGADGAWIRVKNIDVHLRLTDEGVDVGLYPARLPDVEPIVSTYALFSEAEADNGRNLS
jgi:hypothetical protein